MSSPSIAANSSYSISSGGTITDYTDSWNGWYDGGTWSSGKTLGSFTSTNIVTKVGTSGMGGMGSGRPGGW
ncbi:MAG: hypothetical protein NC095_04470 [Muribaculum sp.]|nr:hypothetical protein [Muribaculum sp.]